MKTQTNYWDVTIFDEKNEGICLDDFIILLSKAKEKGLSVIKIESKSDRCSSFIIQFN